MDHEISTPLDICIKLLLWTEGTLIGANKKRFRVLRLRRRREKVKGSFVATKGEEQMYSERLFERCNRVAVHSVCSRDNFLV